MTNRMIENRVNKINELQAQIEELNAQVESLKDEIKSSMALDNIDELDTGKHVIRWKVVFSTRLDSTLLKKSLPDVYSQFSKQTESKRFTIN